MSFTDIIKVIVLGFVQGITEWLPVSSTGHLILFDAFLQLQQSEVFVNTLFVVIQLGSIMAVIVLYFEKLNPFSRRKNFFTRQETIDLWKKVIVAVIPAAVLGLLFDNIINEMFYNPVTVAVMLIVYGILFILIENRWRYPKYRSLEHLDYRTAILIGCFQSLALIPGTSRSGATIVGALLLGTARPVAAEFSFFMAIPTMLGASALKLLKVGLSFTLAEWALLLLGSAVAFIVSVFAIRLLMNYIQRHDFKVFGYYRIILGLLLILYFVIL